MGRKDKSDVDAAGVTPVPPAGKPALVRSVRFEAAWDKRNVEPALNYGVSGVNIHFVLTGPQGAVYVCLMTDWMLPRVQRWHEELAEINPGLLRVNGRALLDRVSVHSRTPRDGWDHFPECEFLGVECWVDVGSYLASDPIWERMLREGDAGFWAALEEIYHLELEPAAGTAVTDAAVTPKDPEGDQ